ncbi:MAG: hypothetical protein QM756_11075 [Polyangiaceae bacterium]
MTFAELKLARPDIYAKLVEADGGDVVEAEATWLRVQAAAEADGVQRERQRCEAIVTLGRIAGVRVKLITHAVEEGVTPEQARVFFAAKARDRAAIDSTFAKLIAGVVPEAVA